MYPEFNPQYCNGAEKISPHYVKSYYSAEKSDNPYS